MAAHDARNKTEPRDHLVTRTNVSVYELKNHDS